MARGVDAPLPDDAFGELALAVFRFQARAIAVYGGLVRGRGLDPDDLADWTRIPPVPVRAFRAFDLVAGGPEGCQAVFRTSGTTGGARGGSRRAARGTHHVRDLGLYRASLLPNARAHLNPRGEPLRVVSLIPAPERRPDSSLAFMAGALARAWDERGGVFLADAEWRVSHDAPRRLASMAAEPGPPVLVLGTAFAFVHLLDRMGEEGTPVRLPPLSRVMETGGFKGRSREVSRRELYDGLTAALGVPGSRIVNEYGMTELLSQFWEPVLREGPGAERAGGEGPTGEGPRGQAAPLHDRVLEGPPWVRTRILDPETLEPVDEGGSGLLCHLDLANLWSVSAILTEDLGRHRGSGFQVLGRTPGTEPRGCSLTMEELLEAGGEAGRGEAGRGEGAGGEQARSEAAP